MYFVFAVSCACSRARLSTRGRSVSFSDRWFCMPRHEVVWRSGLCVNTRPGDRELATFFWYAYQDVIKSGFSNRLA